MPWAVAFHAELAEAFDSFPAAVQDELLAHVKLLAAFGPTLGRPTVGTLKGTKLANLKELRFAAAGGGVESGLCLGPEADRGAAGSRGQAGKVRGAVLQDVDCGRRAALRGMERRRQVMGGWMGVKLDEILDRLPEERRRKVETRAAELIAEEMSLRDLRKALGKTQVAVAKKLGMKQENVSRVEQRADVLLSTLDGYLKALGGRLRLVAEFKGRAPVELTGFGTLKDGHRGKKATSAAKPRRQAA